MGTEIRVLVGARSTTMTPSPLWLRPPSRSRSWSSIVELSRFRPDSELTRLNRDPRGWFRPPRCCVQRWRRGCGRPSALAAWLTRLCCLSSRRRAMRTHAAASLGAARGSPEQRSLTSAGRSRPRPGLALNRSAGRRGRDTATPRGDVRQRRHRQGSWPPTWTGRRLAGYARYAVDCGGDVRVGGKLPDSEPVELQIRHPLSECRRRVVPRSSEVRWPRPGLDARLWPPSRRYACAPSD